MEQRLFIFEHLIDIQDEPAGPGLAITLSDALLLSQYRR